ncbi:hypothetical protein [Streptomyces sp. NRRL S-1521]|uniref:hypothetical protein n=1 Tax=Streptomyces sp. NRRL S-1521 TaxID=1609100 RepID=UPI000746BC67|nr:hypothetical protein [Streptomyces sp. NRRL S-1521]KUL53407.1 hypothetical protein ADL30_20130 [Streptomyces sp. NRRL S-1521]
MKGEASVAGWQGPSAATGRGLIAACLSALLVLLAAACSESGSGSSHESRPAFSAGTSTSADGKHFLFYARYRNSLGEHYFDLLEWRTDPQGALSGSWTSVISSDSGGMKREPHPFNGRQDGNNVTIDLEPDGMDRPVHGSISNGTLTLDVDLAAQSTTYKATTRESFDQIVSSAEKAEASASP